MAANLSTRPSRRRHGVVARVLLTCRDMATDALHHESIAAPRTTPEKNARSDPRAGLGRAILVRLGLGVPVLFAAIFLPAGTVDFWQGWVYLGVLLGMVTAVGVVFYRTAPDLLARRMKMRERETAQKWFVAGAGLIYVAVFILPGLDHRFGWSQMPAWVALLGDAGVVLGYGIVVAVFAANRFARRTIEVEEGQQVVDTGLYAIVRHPMYAGVIIMMTATPLALGSYWAVLPALALPLILVLRILDEERVLRRDLGGYDEYCRKTRYRLIPGVW